MRGEKRMVEITLEQTRKPEVPIFAETITSDKLAGKNAEEIMELGLLEGNRPTKVSELFKVGVKGEPSESVEETTVTITGDTSKFRYIGKGMSGGKIVINGNVGFYLGQQMKGGSITVTGNAGSWIGCMMQGGEIDVSGNAGDYVGAPYRGSRDGMQDGSIVIHGNVGDKAGIWMRGGLISVDGNAGIFLGCDMQDGTIRTQGDCKDRFGARMKGGRIIIAGRVSEVLPTFTFTEIKGKAKFGKEKVSASFYVYSGDTVEDGNGKIFISRMNNLHLNPEEEVFAKDISVNKLVMPVVERMVREAKKLGVEVIKHESGATIIDAGVKTKGSEEAGILTALACVAGLSEFKIEKEKYGDIELPTLHQKTTGHPAAATLAAQYAGWAIKTDDYFALGSGPARAISLQPKKLYQQLAYMDVADTAVLILEADALPTSSAVKYVAETCKVDPKNLYIIVAPTSCIVGSVQTAGRIVETGIHKLTELGFMPNKILSGSGKVPVSPVHPKSEVAMGMVNDMILYAGDVHYEVTCKSDDEILNVIDEAPSTSSRDYGKPFYEVFVAVGGDFYKVDPGLFAPAKITIHNVKTGNTFTAGRINVETLKKSLDLLKKT